jgi:hypothetical protein
LGALRSKLLIAAVEGFHSDVDVPDNRSLGHVTGIPVDHAGRVGIPPASRGPPDLGDGYWLTVAPMGFTSSTFLAQFRAPPSIQRCC